MRRVRQKTSAHCGPAVLQMLVSLYDYRISQDSFVKASGIRNIIKSRGMSPKQLGKAIKKLTDLHFYTKQNTTITELFNLVRKYKIPVGVEWQGVFGKYSDGDDGHYSIVVNVDKRERTVTIADPFRNYARRDRVFKIEEFAKRWWDYNVIHLQSRKHRKINDRQLIFLVASDEIKFSRRFKLKKI